MFLMTTPISTVYKINDIRSAEVRKLLTSIKVHKTSDLPNIATVMKDNLFIVPSDFSVIYHTKLKGGPYDDMPDIGFFENELEEEDDGCLPFNNTAYVYCTNLLCKIIKGDTLVTLSDLQLDPEFQRLLGLKSFEGMELYKILSNNKYYYIPVFSGFPKLNKNDTVGVEISRVVNDTPNIFLVDMTHYSKKLARDIHMYYKILDIE